MFVDVPVLGLKATTVVMQGDTDRTQKWAFHAEIETNNADTADVFAHLVRSEFDGNSTGAELPGSAQSIPELPIIPALDMPQDAPVMGPGFSGIRQVGPDLSAGEAGPDLPSAVSRPDAPQTQLVSAPSFSPTPFVDQLPLSSAQGESAPTRLELTPGLQSLADGQIGAFLAAGRAEEFATAAIPLNAGLPGGQAFLARHLPFATGLHNPETAPTPEPLPQLDETPSEPVEGALESAVKDLPGAATSRSKPPIDVPVPPDLRILPESQGGLEKTADPKIRVDGQGTVPSAPGLPEVSLGGGSGSTVASLADMGIEARRIRPLAQPAEIPFGQSEMADVSVEPLAPSQPKPQGATEWYSAQVGRSEIQAFGASSAPAPDVPQADFAPVLAPEMPQGQSISARHTDLENVTNIGENTPKPSILAGQGLPAADGFVTPITAEPRVDLPGRGEFELSRFPGTHTAGTQPVAISQTHAAEVVRQISGAMSAGQENAVELTLTPEELGRVRMVMSGSDEAITVTIHAERPETGEMIRRHAAALEQELRAVGYSEISFDFADQSGGHQKAPLREERYPYATNDGPATQPTVDTPHQVARHGDGLDLRL